MVQMGFGTDLRARCRARLMLRRDCAAVADYLIRHRLGFGSDPAGLQARLEGLLAARRLRGGLVEVDGGRGGWRLAALGLSSFIEDTTLDAVLQSQDAAFGADLLRGPETRLLDDRAQARLGATGLNLAILTFHFDGEGLAPNLVDLVLARALDHFVAAVGRPKLVTASMVKPCPVTAGSVTSCTEPTWVVMHGVSTPREWVPSYVASTFPLPSLT